MKKKYKVWFDQINQTVFEVEANSLKEAERKAVKDWMACFRDPNASYVEVQDG